MKKLLISLVCLMGLTVFAVQAKEYKKRMGKKPMNKELMEKSIRCPKCPKRKCCPRKRCPKKCPKKCCPRKRSCKRNVRCCKRERVCENVVETVCCPKPLCKTITKDVDVTRYDLEEVKTTKTVPKIIKVCKKVPITVYRTVCEEKVVPVEIPDYEYKAVPRRETECVSATSEVCGEECKEVCRRVCRDKPMKCPCP